MSDFLVIDDAFDADTHAKIFNYLSLPTWSFGWRSNPQSDQFAFWHKHFAGILGVDRLEGEGEQTQYDCVAELKLNAPLIYDLWVSLSASTLKGNVLMRCYANGLTYGSDGSVHVDCLKERSLTAIYYPHSEWSPNWGGETMLFNATKTDIIACIYPRPNRLAIFSGRIPHVARGVSRKCPEMRITLMFKTESPPS
jgi:SM-20-related protein